MELTFNALKIHKTTAKLASSIALSINGGGCCTTPINADFAFIKLLKCVN
jgi:hypothetical protein